MSNAISKLMRVPLRYIPKQLTRKDKGAQARMLKKSRGLYKKHVFYTRKNISSYKNKKSGHVSNARRIYGIEHIAPNRELAAKSGCSIAALNQIVRKGKGAYYSSGSRPNQTPQSWGLARLASALTSGKAAAVDYNIIEKGCDHTKRAFRLARRSKQKYGHGQGSTRKIKI